MRAWLLLASLGLVLALHPDVALAQTPSSPQTAEGAVRVFLDCNFSCGCSPIQYTIGFDYFDYKEETVFAKTSETLADHRLQTSLSMRQPWGSSFASVSFSQFLTRPSKYSITAFGDANVRLFKGFSFNVFGEVARTRDQLYLRRGEASTEEILVRQRQLATGYRYFMQIGISYSFGSIFNNVVNPRFGS